MLMSLQEACTQRLKYIKQSFLHLAPDVVRIEQSTRPLLDSMLLIVWVWLLLNETMISSLFVLKHLTTITSDGTKNTYCPSCFPPSHFSVCPPLIPDQDGSLNSGGRQDSVVGSGLPQTLQQEFSLVNLQIRNVNVEVRL